jgi:hypothetical protein
VKITTHDLNSILKSLRQDKAGVKLGEMKQQEDVIQDIAEQELEALKKEGILCWTEKYIYMGSWNYTV